MNKTKCAHVSDAQQKLVELLQTPVKPAKRAISEELSPVDEGICDTQVEDVNVSVKIEVIGEGQTESKEVTSSPLALKEESKEGIVEGYTFSAKHLTDEVKATRRRKKIDPNENALRNIADRDDAAASLTR